jgi:Arm DNA-binding domain
MPKLTQATLRRLIKKTGRHADGGGLYFRVIGKGRCYWTYRYRVGGKEREASLGPFPELTLAEAREKHAALRKSVVVHRADPLAEKRGAKTMQAVNVVPTFGDMAQSAPALVHLASHLGNGFSRHTDPDSCLAA